MKLNKEFIKQLRNGEIAAENNGTLEQLTEVLKAAFLEDTLVPDGYCKYYWKHRYSIYDWGAGNSTTLPTISVSDFYQPELFTGWAKDDEHPKWMIYFKNDVAKFGFNVFGEWCDGVESAFCKYSEDLNILPATHKEIEQGLAEEAKRRGYEAGITCFFREDMYRRFLGGGEIKYIPNWANGYGALSLGYDVIFREDTGQWAEIIEQPSQVKPKDKTNPIHYTVEGTKYSFNYQELKAKYESVVNYSDEQFMGNLPEIAHLACIVSYFKGLGAQATISDKGIIHELIHLMTDPDEPTNDLQEIRESFNDKIKLV